MNTVILVDGLGAAGVPEDCDLSDSSVRQSGEKQPCGTGGHEFWCLGFFGVCFLVLGCFFLRRHLP